MISPKTRLTPARASLLKAASAIALAVALGSTAACATTGAQSASDMPPLPPAATAPIAAYPKDVHSYAQPDVARVKHVDLKLTADFDARTLTGTATLDVTGRAGATELVLDTRDLDIRGVRNAAGPLAYVVGDADPILGRPLTIATPAFVEGEAQTIMVDYATRPEAAALQWLTPAQTSGGKLPFLFSQGQAILTRTWAPTQDSPGVRQTYSATITVPDDLKALMSAEDLTPDGVPAGPGLHSYAFRMTNPVPPYLIAIAVGDLAFAAEDRRTGVWTEPNRLDAAHAELVEVGQMVDEAEALYGPYAWGRYDLLILPPSFPFGGMENPRLTFATPTIIAGDRSLVSLVAHELAHSWSGNLVTNAVWADFWLNEGFTTYFQNRIMEAVYGNARAQQERVLGWDSLQGELASLPAADTRLHLNLDGRDPDEGMSEIAYEKGALFLTTIERIVGRERFDAWLKGYFERNAFRPMTSELFLQDIRAHLVDTPALEAEIKLDEWVYQPGLPSNAVAPTSDAFVAVDAAAQTFFVAHGPASAIPWSGWNTQQRQRFLQWRPADPATDWLTAAQLADLSATLNLAQEGNAEIAFAWLQIAVAHRYEPAVPQVEHFLTTIGRRKFVMPLFSSLWAEGDWGRPIATRIYAQARPGYHTVTTRSVDALVGVPAA